MSRETTGKNANRRRRLLVIPAALAGLALVAGCSGGGGGSADDDKSTAPEPDNSSAEQIVFASYGGSLQEAEEKAFIQPFEEESGIKVLSDGPVEFSKIRAQVESDSVSWDVVNMDPDFALENCGILFEEIDTSIVTNLADANPDYVAGDCFVPHYTFGWVLMYDTEVYGDNPPTSWADFYDLEKFPGKRGAWVDDSTGLIETALMADGVAPADLYPLDVERAFAKLDSVKGEMVWAEAPGQVSEDVLAGNIDMAIMYTGRAYDAVKEDDTWQAAWSATPIVSYVGVSILKGTKHLEEAMQLANQFASLESQNSFPTYISYGPIRDDATPDVDELQQEFMLLNLTPDQYNVNDVSWWVENREDVDAQWTAWQAG